MTRVVAAVYALWLFAMMLVFYLGHAQDATSLEIVFLAGVVPVFLQLTILGMDWRGLIAPVRLWFALIAVILCSYIANAFDPHMVPLMENSDLPVSPAWTWVIYVFNTFLLFGIATVVAGAPGHLLLRTIAEVFCVPATLFLVYVDATGTMVWGRLATNGITSNVWGLMGLNLCVTAFARKLGLISIAAFLVGSATILQASSREHMLALVIGVLVAVFLWLRDANLLRLVVALATVGIGALAAAFLIDPYLIGALHYIASDVLVLGSGARGLDSGFTGRTDIWQATFDLWMRHPFFGVGFRQHELFLEGGVPAHNAYLAMLADTGVAGFIAYVVLLLKSSVTAWSIEDGRMRRFVVLMLVTYIVIGLFDRRTIDAGNTDSLFFVMCCAAALTDDSLRRHAVRDWSMAT